MEANSPATSFGPKAAVLDTKGEMGGINGKERKLPLAAERFRERAVAGLGVTFFDGPGKAQLPVRGVEPGDRPEGHRGCLSLILQ